MKNNLQLFFKKIAKQFCQLFRFELSDKKWNNLLQFIKFGFVGISNTVISYVVYYILIKLSVHYLLASVIGFIASVVNSFFWNNKYVFKKGTDEHRSLVLSFIKTFISYAWTGLFLSNILLYIWVDKLGIGKVIAPIINLLITVPLNFIINKFWAFKTKKTLCAVVTGATSFIGSALLKSLLSHGIECYAIVRPESKNISVLPDDKKLHIVLSDVSDTDKWIHLIPKCDVFYHFAWDGIGADGRADKKIQQSNIIMSIKCLKAAAKAGCKRFVFAGSQAEYGECSSPTNEKSPCNPHIEYGKAKLKFLNEATDLSKSLSIDYVHLRIFSIYGPGDHPWTLVSQCIDSFSKGKTIELSTCNQMWNYLYIDDVAEAIYRTGVCKLDGNNIFNIGSDESRPLKEYVEAIHEACGCNGVPVYGTRKNIKEKAIGIQPVTTHVKTVTGWSEKTSFEEGIRITVNEWKGKNI